MSTTEDPYNVTDVGYMVLPSNVPSLPGLEENRTNNYTTALAKPIDTSKIDGEIEVALVEISFAHSWSTYFPAKRCAYEVFAADVRYPLKPPVRATACLPPGQIVQDYASVEELVAGLNLRRPRLDDLPNGVWAGRFRVRKTGVQIILFEGEAVELDPILAEVLGLEKNTYTFAEGELMKTTGLFSDEDLLLPASAPSTVRGETDEEGATSRRFKRRKRRATLAADSDAGDLTLAAAEAAGAEASPPSPSIGDGQVADAARETQPSSEPLVFDPQEGPEPLKRAKRYLIRAIRQPDLTYNSYNIMVYSDLVKRIPVGNVQTPLLRSVPCPPSERGKYLSRVFDRPRYLPLNNTRYDAIRIEVRHEDGTPVRFKYGKLICTLHFRRRRKR